MTRRAIAACSRATCASTRPRGSLERRRSGADGRSDQPPAPATRHESRRRGRSRYRSSGAMKLLDLTTETDGTTVRLALTGELDIAGAGRVEQELERIEREPPATIVLDLRELEFMDSTGLRVIVAADGRAREQARRLVIVRGSETVQRIIEMTRLHERLDIVDDLAAVEAT